MTLLRPQPHAEFVIAQRLGRSDEYEVLLIVEAPGGSHDIWELAVCAGAPTEGYRGLGRAAARLALERLQAAFGRPTDYVTMSENGRAITIADGYALPIHSDDAV